MRSQAFFTTTGLAVVDANKESGLLLCNAAGFFLAFKVCVTFLFFQSNPQTGAAVTVALTLCLLSSVIFYRTIDPRPQGRLGFTRPMCWVMTYLGLSAASLTWIQASSPAVAASYWLAMAAEVGTIYLLLSCEPVEVNAVRVMYGFIGGAAVVALIAWVAPVMDDMRLGNEVFMHPNAIGFEFAIATLLAIHLAQRKRAWAWVACGFAITLIRTLSKGTIVGFLFASLYFLIRGLKISRKIRFYIGVASTLVLMSFWGILEAYVDLYTQGSNVETLTGRTYIWLQALEVATEKPWFGHGFDSFRWIVPPLGDFQPGHAHNDLVQQFVAYGVAGVIVMCGAYWTFYRQARVSKNKGLKSLAMAILILVLVRGLVDTDRFEPCFPLWLMTMLSIVLARSGVPQYSS